MSSQSLLNLRGAFQDAAANGVTVLGSSGDGGTANATKQSLVGNNPNNDLIPFPTVEWPASDPLVTGSAARTSARTPTRARRGQHQPAHELPVVPSVREIAWIDAGGGFSHVRRPATRARCRREHRDPVVAAGRPDVGLQAVPAGALVYLRSRRTATAAHLRQRPGSTGWYDIGGTSLSCPQWAGMVAIADQVNGGGLGLINPGLYRIGADPVRYANDFYDVTTGNNQADPDIPGFPATTGWDPVTGLGTPNAANLIPDLVAAAHGH